MIYPCRKNLRLDFVKEHNRNHPISPLNGIDAVVEAGLIPQDAAFSVTAQYLISKGSSL